MIKPSLEMRLKTRIQPEKTPLLFQQWRDLLFLHFKCNPELIQRELPKGLFVDTFQDSGFISIIPFFMHVSFLNHSLFPRFSNFLELNFRTYVYDQNGTPGIWFYSLDLNSALGSFIGQNLFSLPYFNANIIGEKREDEIKFSGFRKSNPKNEFEFRYTPRLQMGMCDNESIDFFLIERYFLFASCKNQLYRLQVHHDPYYLSEISHLQWNMKNEINEKFNFPSTPSLIHYSKGVDVQIFKMEKIANAK